VRPPLSLTPAIVQKLFFKREKDESFVSLGKEKQRRQKKKTKKR